MTAPAPDGGGRARAARLARIEAEVADAGQRVTEQAIRCETMEFDGHDTQQAMKLLRTFESIYVELVRCRQTLLGEPW